MLPEKSACSSRPVPHAVTALKHPDTAVLWLPPNETWRTIRKALSLYLTNQQKLDNLMHIRENVVEDAVEFLRESGRKKVPVDIGTLAFAVSVNEFSNTFFSKNMTKIRQTVGLDGKIEEAKILNLFFYCL
nr:geraniol 8-hydroxylase-like [Tanacetum cinerariifolium]